MRAQALRQDEYGSTRVLSATCAATGRNATIIVDLLNTEAMNLHLAEIAEIAGDQCHAVLVMDNAAWHKASGLVWPANITPLYLPPYSPQLNPVERLWTWMRRRFFHNRVFPSHDALVQAALDFWNSLTPDVVRSVCANPLGMPMLVSGN